LCDKTGTVKCIDIKLTEIKQICFYLLPVITEFQEISLYA